MLPFEQREKITEVSLDMWSTFINLAREFFPNARIVIDRFHVMQHVSKVMDKIRVVDYKQLTGEEKKQVKGIRWIMNKRSSKLTEIEKDILNKWFSLINLRLQDMK